MSNRPALQNFSAPQRQLWQRGFWALFQRELETWRWRKLLTGTLLWTALINGIGVVTSGVSVSTGSSTGTFIGTILVLSAWMFLPMLGTIFSLQGILSHDRKSGTMSWILSKPIFRSAFYLAKLSVRVLMNFLIIVLFQGLFLYGHLATQGNLLNLPGLLKTMLIIWVILLFYQSLTTMLDTILNNRAAAIAIPVAVLLLGVNDLIRGVAMVSGVKWLQAIVDFLYQVLPWGLKSEHLQGLLAGRPLESISPVLGTAILAVGFTAVGIWHFNRQEI